MSIVRRERYGFVPTNPIEWLPFIEGLDRAGDYVTANELMIWVRTGSPHCKHAVLEMLKSLREDTIHCKSPADQLDRQIALLSTEDQLLQPLGTHDLEPTKSASDRTGYSGQPRPNTLKNSARGCRRSRSVMR